MKEKLLDKDTIDAYHSYVQSQIRSDLNSISLGPGKFPTRLAQGLTAFGFCCLLVGILLITLRMQHVYFWDWEVQFVGPFFIILFLMCLAGATYFVVMATRRANRFRRELYFQPLGDYGISAVHTDDLVHEQEMKHDLKSGTTPHKNVMPRSEAYSQMNLNKQAGHHNQAYRHGPSDPHRQDRRGGPPSHGRRGPGPDDGRRRPNDDRRGPPPQGEHRRGPPPDDRGRPRDDRPEGGRGPPRDDRRGPPPPGGRYDRRGPPRNDGRPYDDVRGPPRNDRRGPPPDDRRGPPSDDRRGPPSDDRRGPPSDDRRGPPSDDRRGPPRDDDRRPPPDRRGPPHDDDRRPRGMPHFKERSPDDDLGKIKLEDNKESESEL